MSVKLDKKKTKSKLVLPEVTDAYVTQELKDALLDAFAHGKPLTIKGDKVSTVDTTCCQMLVAAEKHYNLSGVGFELKDSSAPLLRALNRLGMNHLLNSENA